MAKSRYNSKADRAMKQRFERSQKKRAEKKRAEAQDEVMNHEPAAVSAFDTRAEDSWLDSWLLYAAQLHDYRKRTLLDTMDRLSGSRATCREVLAAFYTAIGDALDRSPFELAELYSRPEEPDLEVLDPSGLNGLLRSFGCENTESMAMT